MQKFYDYKEFSPNVRLRKRLGLYGFLTHSLNIPGITSRHSNVDIIVIRENLEGEYTGLEHEVVPGVIESLKVITTKNSLKIANFAFEFA